MFGCNSVFLCSVGLVVGGAYLCLGFDAWADWMGLFVLGVVRYWLDGFSGWVIVLVVFGLLVAGCNSDF